MSRVEIEGSRVVLVPLVAGDAEELAGLLDDDYTRGALGVGDLKALRGRFAAWERRRSPDGTESWLNWVVRDREDRRALGWAQATVGGARASVAYALLDEARGRGVASDAVRALTACLDAREIVAWIAPGNVASQRVVRAAGFVETERRRADGEVLWTWQPPCSP
jgi:RimJ/RimL family protein N-acetyltransferase